MAGLKVRALYDFSGEPGTAEISITAGEIISVIRQDVGGGWWEGETTSGQTGLFPEAYVEIVASSKPPSVPAPALPPTYNEPAQQEWGWGDQENNQDTAAQSSDYDEDWDNESENGQPPSTVQQQEFKSENVGEPAAFGRGTESKASVKKNFNRFSTFVKSGCKDYILGNLKVSVHDVDKVFIQDVNGRVEWDPITEHYQCFVASPKKESKLKGFKSYIAYQLTPTFNNLQVSRRYKHFDWLHERLEEKFSLIPIPPLPDKQISGRYEEQFIEHRRVQLQAFVNSVCRHPVLSRCNVWTHFITCTDEKLWKAGKRRAEKDELVGANYFACLQAPERPLNTTELDMNIEIALTFALSMDSSVKNLITTANDQSKKYQTTEKKEYQRIGQAFSDLGYSFAMEDCAESLTKAIQGTGEAYKNIGQLYGEQPRCDWEPLADNMHIYKGILASFPDILNVHKGALQKCREIERVSNENMMVASGVQDVRRRTDVMSYALLAEITHFHDVRAVDFKDSMKEFLSQQISFYEKVIVQLQTALATFD